MKVLDEINLRLVDDGELVAEAKDRPCTHHFGKATLALVERVDPNSG